MGAGEYRVSEGIIWHFPSTEPRGSTEKGRSALHPTVLPNRQKYPSTGTATAVPDFYTSWLICYDRLRHEV